MMCVNCDNKNTKKIFEEELQGEGIIGYYICEECNLVWTALNNEFIVGVISSGVGFYEGIVELLGLGKANIIDENQSMDSFIHRCLKCNTFSYEKEKNLWCCPECGFEWEMINDD